MMTGVRFEQCLKLFQEDENLPHILSIWGDKARLESVKALLQATQGASAQQPQGSFVNIEGSMIETPMRSFIDLIVSSIPMASNLDSIFNTFKGDQQKCEKLKEKIELAKHILQAANSPSVSEQALASSYILMNHSEFGQQQGEKWMEVNNEDFGDDDAGASILKKSKLSLQQSQSVGQSQLPKNQQQSELIERRTSSSSGHMVQTETGEEFHELDDRDRSETLNNAEMASLRSLVSQIEELTILSRNTSTRLESLEKIVEQLQKAMAKHEQQQSGLSFWFYLIMGPCCIYALLSLLRLGR